MQRTSAYRFVFIDLVWSLGLGILQSSLGDSQVLDTGLTTFCSCPVQGLQAEGWSVGVGGVWTVSTQAVGWVCGTRGGRRTGVAGVPGHSLGSDCGQG